MTHALHELIPTCREIDTSHETSEYEARMLQELGTQLKATAEQIARDHEASHDDIEDLREASESLAKTLGHVATSELVEMMDAAVACDDPELTAVAINTLEQRFPYDVSDPGLLRANIRSVLDYKKAMGLAKENGTPVSAEMANAAGINDMNFGANFDDTIVVSNWTVKEQRGELTDERDQRDLKALRELEAQRMQELLRREEERRKLEAMGQEDNSKFDDAVAYDPFADDDEDEAA